MAARYPLVVGAPAMDRAGTSTALAEREEPRCCRDMVRVGQVIASSALARRASRRLIGECDMPASSQTSQSYPIQSPHGSLGVGKSLRSPVAGQCQLRVVSGHSDKPAPCPLYPK